jgi:hypothetical protein
MAKKSERSGVSRKSQKAPAKKAKSTKKSSAHHQPALAVTKPHSLPAKRFRFHKLTKHPVKLPSVWYITQTTARIMWRNIVLFLALIGWYALLNLIFVQGLIDTTNTNSLKTTLQHIFSSNVGSSLADVGKYVLLAGSSAGSATPTAGFYQLVFAIVTSLAVIWTLRQLYSGAKIKIRDAYYRGMYPIIPFILILLVICIQLLPFVIGATIYTTVVSTGIAFHFIEITFWFLLLVLLTLWSLYMVTATVFALYIVTLPNMTPLESIRSARSLVQHRRWTVLRKILFLPLLLLLLTALIMLPIILVLPSLAPWVLFILTMAGLVGIHGYMYTLYRELLNE